jgi:hypothetical protein
LRNEAFTVPQGRLGEGMNLNRDQPAPLYGPGLRADLLALFDGGHADGQRRGLDLHLQVGRLPEGIAVELDVELLARLDDDLLALARVRVQPARDLPTRDRGEHTEPLAEVLRADDEHVEHAVVDDRLRQQLDSALQLPAVAAEHRAHPGRDPIVVVERDLDLAGPTRELARAGLDIGQPAEAALELIARIRHHCGVEAEPGHDGEDMGVAVLGDLRSAHIDVAIAAPQCDPQRPFRLVEDEVEVASEQIPRSQRNDPHRGGRAHQRRGDRPDGPVTAGGYDDVDPLIEGADRRPLTRVMDGRLKHKGRVPSLETADRLGGGGEPAGIGFDRIDDEGGTVPGRIADLPVLVGEVRGVGVAAHRVEDAAAAGAAAEEEHDREHDDGADDDEPGHQGVELDGHVPNLPC